MKLQWISVFGAFGLAWFGLACATTSGTDENVVQKKKPLVFAGTQTELEEEMAAAEAATGKKGVVRVSCRWERKAGTVIKRHVCYTQSQLDKMRRSAENFWRQVHIRSKTQWFSGD